MSTNSELAEYVRGIISRLGLAEKRKMFDVYCFYLNGKAVGFLVEDQALVKTNAAMRKLWPDIEQALLFEGAVNPMWVINDLDDVDTVCKLYGRALKYLPEPKAKVRKNKVQSKGAQSNVLDGHLPGSPLLDPALMGECILSPREIQLIKATATKKPLSK